MLCQRAAKEHEAFSGVANTSIRMRKEEVAIALTDSAHRWKETESFFDDARGVRKLVEKLGVFYDLCCRL